MSFLAPLAGPILGSVASAGASSLIGGLFGDGSTGGTQQLQQFKPVNFTGGGLRSTFNPETGIDLRSTGARARNVNDLAKTFGNQATATGNLLGQVAPGMSALRRARLGALNNAKTSAIGNLRENLASRRVLGSSFGQDTLARAEAEFAQQQDQIEADSFLKELDLTNQLNQQMFTEQRGQFQTHLDELNLEASLATKLATTATTALASNAQTSAKLDALSQQGAGQFAGQLAQPIGDAVSKGFSSLFPSGTNAGNIGGTGGFLGGLF